MLNSGLRTKLVATQTS